MNNKQQGSSGGAGERWAEATWRKERNTETDAQMAVTLGDPRRNRSPKRWQLICGMAVAHFTGLTLIVGMSVVTTGRKVFSMEAEGSLTPPQRGISLSLSPARHLLFVSALHPHVEPGTTLLHPGPGPFRQWSFYKAKSHSQKKPEHHHTITPTLPCPPSLSLSETELRNHVVL